MDPPPMKRFRASSRAAAMDGENDSTEDITKLARVDDEAAGDSTATPSTTAATSPSQQMGQQKEQRSVQACSRCRRLKSKCIRSALAENSAASDICKGCKAAGVPCTFDTGPTPKRSRPSREPSTSAQPPPSSQPQPSTPQQQPSSMPTSSYSYSIPSGLPFSAAPLHASPPMPIPPPPSSWHAGASTGYPGQSSLTYDKSVDPSMPSSSGGLEARVVSLEGEMGRMRAQMDMLVQPMLSGTYAFPMGSSSSGSIQAFGPSPSLPHPVRPQAEEFHLPRLPIGPTSHAHPETDRRSLPPPTPGSYSLLGSPRQTHTSDGSYAYQPSSSRRPSTGGAGPSMLSRGSPLAFVQAAEEQVGPHVSRLDVDESSDLMGCGVVDESMAKIALEFYISDMALHTPYITFLSTSVSSEQIQQLRRSSSLLFNTYVTIALRALDQDRYDEGVRLVRQAAARLVEDGHRTMTIEDLRGLVLFSIWQADPFLTALSVQVAHASNLHTALQRYTSLADPFSPEGAHLMDLGRLYASIHIHEHLLNIFSSSPPLLSLPLTPHWQSSLSLHAHPSPIDSYLTSYLLLADLLSLAQTSLSTSPPLPLSTRLAEASRLHGLLLQWHASQHAADSLITIVPVSFCTVWLFSPLAYDQTDTWGEVMREEGGEGRRQVREATETAGLLVELVLKTWRGRPMVRYTRDLHGYVLGMALGHLVGVARCCEGEERDGAVERLKGVLRTWDEFGLETEGCLLGRILNELDEGEGSGRDAWEEFRAKRWGKEMWDAIVPSGRLKQDHHQQQ